MRLTAALALLLLVPAALPAAARTPEATPVSKAVDPACATELPPPRVVEITLEVEAQVAAMPLEVKVGQMLMSGVSGTTLSNDDLALFADLHLGNVLLMGRSSHDPAQVLALTNAIQEAATAANGVGALIAVDQEGGLVQRLSYTDGFTPLPAAEIVGLADCPALARDLGRLTGSELAAVGVNMDMAPDLDVNVNPDNPVIGGLARSFGATPELVEASALPFAAGLRDAGLLAVGKHFPGHGSTTADSHLELPMVDKPREDLLAVDVAPFAAAVAFGIDGVMPAHVLYPALEPDDRPASVSAAIQTGLLRGELGFTGLIVSDDLGMKGITSRFTPEDTAVEAVLAGTDILLCAANPGSTVSCPPEMVPLFRDGLLAAVKTGRIPESRIDASVARILAYKAAVGVGAVSADGLSAVGSAEHYRILSALYERIAETR